MILAFGMNKVIMNKVIKAYYETFDGTHVEFDSFLEHCSSCLYEIEDGYDPGVMGCCCTHAIEGEQWW